MIYDLLNRADNYLTQRSSLKDLERWLLSNLQRVLDSGDKKAIEVANQIDADLVEFGEQLIDEATLRQRLEGYIRSCEYVSIAHGGVQSLDNISASTQAETIRTHFELPTRVIDLQFHHQFV